MNVHIRHRETVLYYILFLKMLAYSNYLTSNSRYVNIISDHRAGIIAVVQIEICKINSSSRYVGKRLFFEIDFS